MARLGAQPANRICGVLLDEICSGSNQPCALLDPSGRIIAASALFLAVAQREPGMGELLKGAPPAVSAAQEAWLDDGWLVVRASVLPGSVLTVVEIYGPAVVRARVARTYATGLSAREAECLALALEGAENGMVASRLGVRPETVKVHLRNAYRKLRAGGRAEILARLVETV